MRRDTGATRASSQLSKKHDLASQIANPPSEELQRESMMRTHQQLMDFNRKQANSSRCSNLQQHLALPATADVLSTLNDGSEIEFNDRTGNENLQLVIAN